MDRPHFTEEQMAIFKRMVTPTLFDPSPIKRKYLDVQYGKLPEQKVDVYLPDEGDGPFPLIIFIHGGANTGTPSFPWITAWPPASSSPSSSLT